MTTRVKIGSNEIFGIELVSLRRTNVGSDAPNLYGIARIAGVDAGFSWNSGELSWDEAESIGVDGGGEYVYLMEGVLEIEQAQLEYVEEVLQPVVDFWIKRMTDLR
jgi:hypothetical protein